MAVRDYDAKRVAVTFQGVTVTGFHDGDKVSVERNEDTWTFQPDTDGGGTRSRTNNTSGRFTLTLSQTSPVNQQLSDIAKADERDGSGKGPMSVIDTAGGSQFLAETAWLVKPPVAGFGSESGERVWVFETDQLEWNEGGNS